MTDQQLYRYLCHSLDCGLKVQTPDGIKTLVGIDLFTGTVQVSQSTRDRSKIKIYGINEVTPICYGLDMLTKPIWHNNLEFVPMEVLFITHWSKEKEFDELPSFIRHTFNLTTGKVEYHQIQYWIIKQLIEWHFAVGLKKGSWIDVNTLPENCYK